MHIFQVSASYKPAYVYGGPTMSVSKLSEELVKAGQNVSVISTTANGTSELDVTPGEEQIIDGVSVIYFKRLTKDHSHFSPALFKYLFRALKTSTNQQINKSTVIHIHAWWNLVSMISCFIALWKQKPVILSPRGTLSNYSFKNRSSIIKNIFHTLIGKPLLKRCNFHVTSEKERQDIIDIITPKTITVIPNFVRFPDEFKLNHQKISIQKNLNLPSKPEGETSKNPFKLLFLSRIEEKKGLDLLFMALKEVTFHWTLSIAGDGKPEYIYQLKQLIISLGINNNLVTWLGHQNQDEKFSVLSEHDLLVLPSHDENFANVVIESLAMGTPVLISKKVGLADYIVEQDFGWISNTNQLELSQTLNVSCKDFKKRELIRKIAPQKIRNDFNNERLVKRYIEMYTKIIIRS
jgi:glycosyltransferase involved in cell wall biosynthesis